MDKNDLRKMINMRPKARRNYDADFSESTVIMESGQGEQDGVPIYYAYPTLFPNDQTSKTTTSHPDDWHEYEEGDWGAYDEAKKRKEVFYFDTAKEAEEFALGSWKPKLKEKQMRDVFNKMLKAAGE